MTIQREQMTEKTDYNESFTRKFIQIFYAMPKHISASLHKQTLEHNESFTPRLYSRIFRNAKRHFYELE
jgi:hypothetical protein